MVTQSLCGNETCTCRITLKIRDTTDTVYIRPYFYRLCCLCVVFCHWESKGCTSVL